MPRPPRSSADSRLLARLAEATAGFYVYSPERFGRARAGCLRLVGQQVGAGMALACSSGLVRGWLRPRIQERSAAFARGLLASTWTAFSLIPCWPSRRSEARAFTDASMVDICAHGAPA